jgi:hypothetical protein
VRLTVAELRKALVSSRCIAGATFTKRKYVFADLK